MAATKLGTAYIPVDGDWSAFNRKFDQHSRDLNQKSRKLGRAVGLGVTAAAAGAVAAGKALYDIGAQFDDATDKIRINTGRTGKQLERLKGDFKAVVQDVPADFDSASTAVAGLSERLGLTGKPLQRISGQMLELSRITGTDLTTNIDSVTRTFGDWGVVIAKQPKALDAMFRASQRTGISVSDLGQQLVKYGAPLRQMGFDFNEAAATLAKFRKEGVNGELVMGSLRIALGKMAKEGVTDAGAGLEKITRQIKEAGSTGEANARALEVFGARAGPDMAAAIREGRFDLGKLYDQIAAGKDTIGRASRDTQDFTEKWQLFRNEMAVKLEPVATRVFDTVGEKADDLFRLIDNPHLTVDEKFDRVFDEIGDVIDRALPEIGERVAQAAPKVASAFVDGFVDADAWGRLVLGGLLLRKMGGLGAFASFGTRAGNAMAGGVAAAPSWKTRMAGVGKAGALAAAIAFGPEFVKKAFDKTEEIELPDDLKIKLPKAGWNPLKGVPLLGDATEWLDNNLKLHGIDKASNDLRQFAEIAQDAFKIDVKQGDWRGLRDMGSYARDLADRFEDYDEPLLEYAAAAERMAERVARSVGKPWLNSIKRSWDQFHKSGATSMESIREATERNMRIVKDRIGIDTEAGRRAAATNFRLAADAIKESMESGAIDTKTGSRLIRGYLVDALTSMGLTDAQARAKLKTGTIQTDRNPSGAGKVGAARGALVQFGQPGQAGHDSIAARIGGTDVMVAPGEVAAVFNRHQLPEIQARLADYGGLAGFFQKHRKPHYMAGGGIVPIPGFPGEEAASSVIDEINLTVHKFGVRVSDAYDRDRSAGHSSPGHNVTGTAVDFYGSDAAMDAAAKYWASKGYTVGYDGRFGTQAWSGHGPSYVAGANAHLHVEFGGGTGNVGGFTGPTPDVQDVLSMLAGGPGALANRALNIEHGAAQSIVDRVASSMRAMPDIGGGPVRSVTGNGSALMKAISQHRGWNFGDWWEIDRRETGHGNDIFNESSGAWGRGQFMPGVTQGSYGPGSSPGANPSMAQQIQSMAAYIADRYGNPSAALAFHNAHNWYAGGGIVPTLKGKPQLQPTTRTPSSSIAPLRRILRAPRISNVHALLERFKGIGLPEGMQDRLAKLAKNNEIFSSFADRAGQLTVRPDTGGLEDLPYAELKQLVQQKLGVPVGNDLTRSQLYKILTKPELGTVDGRTEADWLGLQLDTLFEWRNKLVRALDIIHARRDQVERLTKTARTTLAGSGDRLDTLKDRRKRLQRDLETAQKHPKKNADRIKALRQQIGGLNDQINPLERTRQQIVNSVLPGLSDTDGRLVTARGEARSQLNTVQGPGGPMTVMRQLPDISVLGGSIFDVRQMLKELQVPEPTISDSEPESDTDTDTGTDTGTEPAPDSTTDSTAEERARLAEERARLAELRFAVSQRQYDVFRKMPAFAGTFHTGGVVPGHAGQERTAIVQAGEIITPANSEPAVIQPIIQVIVHDGAVDASKIEAVVQSVTRREARSAARVLPGRGGGIITR